MQALEENAPAPKSDSPSSLIVGENRLGICKNHQDIIVLAVLAIVFLLAISPKMPLPYPQPAYPHGQPAYPARQPANPSSQEDYYPPNPPFTNSSPLNYPPGGAFAILEHSQESNTCTMHVVLQNVQAGDRYLKQAYFEGQGRTGIAMMEYSQGHFVPGEKKQITLPFDTGGCISGTTYEYGVRISFTDSEGNAYTQFGAKTLAGKVS